MRHRRLALAALALSLSAAPGSPLTFETAGFVLQCSANNIRATRAGRPVFDLRGTTISRWRDLLKDSPPSTSAQQNDRLISAIGGIVSLEESEYCDCGGAHPSAVAGFRTIDLKTGAPAKLDKLFPAADLYKALLQDSVVRNSLGTRHPESYEALAKAIVNHNVTSGDCDYFFSADWLEHFAFYDVRDHQVAVRIAVSHGSEICRGQMLQIGLWLPIPDRLAPALQAAKMNKSGLLMIDTKAATPEIHFTFGGK